MLRQTTSEATETTVLLMLTDTSDLHCAVLGRNGGRLVLSLVQAALSHAAPVTARAVVCTDFQIEWLKQLLYTVLTP